MFKFFKNRRDSGPADSALQGGHRNFVCPGCNNKTLKIRRSIELGSDSRDDEYSLQAISCEECGFVGVATYRESRRGAEESWDHCGYRMENSNFEAFLKILRKCRRRRRPSCSCRAHSHFGVKDEYGTLNPLGKLELEKTRFAMRIR
jgi:hypothetical protein